MHTLLLYHTHTHTACGGARTTSAHSEGANLSRKDAQNQKKILGYAEEPVRVYVCRQVGASGCLDICAYECVCAHVQSISTYKYSPLTHLHSFTITHIHTHRRKMRDENNDNMKRIRGHIGMISQKGLDGINPAELASLIGIDTVW
jgi:hypothetical protein